MGHRASQGSGLGTMEQELPLTAVEGTAGGAAGRLLFGEASQRRHGAKRGVGVMTAELGALFSLPPVQVCSYQLIVFSHHKLCVFNLLLTGIGIKITTAFCENVSSDITECNKLCRRRKHSCFESSS